MTRSSFLTALALFATVFSQSLYASGSAQDSSIGHDMPDGVRRMVRQLQKNEIDNVAAGLVSQAQIVVAAGSRPN